ncbi:MAG TPA: glycosyltransferase, partial [Anaerolineales bacterium]|nr:glycosyltransferase [Anaerolineales bacterium]
MNNQPLVSVIMIFLNAGRFIEEAVESVFTQSYENWELLFVDDGSVDRSTSIAQAYADRYPHKVRYLEHTGHQNRGKCASRNLGIGNTRGDYIVFLDADDVWLPDKLKRQIAILETQPEAVMLYGLSLWWYSWTGNPEDSQRDFVHELGVPPGTLIQPPTLLTLFFLSQQATIPGPSNILVRREILEKVGGFEEVFQGTYDVYEDQAFYAKVCLTAPVFASNECWDRYRQHPDSSMAHLERNNQEIKTRLFFLNWLARYLEEHEYKDSEIWRSLHKQIWQYRFPVLRNILHGKQRMIRWTNEVLFTIARRMLPVTLRHRLWASWRGQPYIPPVGRVRIGDLRRLTPLSREFGFDRGQPIDRSYIEKFLAGQQQDIKGHVLEILEPLYTRQFGGERVLKTDVLHVEPGHPGTTIVADLVSADHIPSDTFDCIILTQTLQFIYDIRAALLTLYRILKPGGVLLATIPGLSPISRYDMERWGHYWGFTSLSAQRLFEEVFPADHVKIQVYGNVLTATAFLYGMVTEELTQQEFEHFDPDYEVIIAVRAMKPGV